MSWKLKSLLVILFLVPTIMSEIPVAKPQPKPVAKAQEPSYHIVKVTMYTVDPKQTDDTPLETASGFIVDSLNPKKHRIIAVSRDLKKLMKWGQKVRVEGIGMWDGVYYVRDLMNKRFSKRIDILINPGERDVTFTKAKLFKL